MILVLTQRSRPDRLRQFYLDNPSLSEAIPFYAVEENGMAPFQSFCHSQYNMLKYFLENSDDQGLIAFEDDCILKGPIPVLDITFDLMYLGCNLQGIAPGGYSTDPFRRIKTAWMTHAIIYTRHCVEFIISNYDPNSNQMYDDWLSNQLENLLAYVTNPMIAWQRPGMSELWGTVTDYTYTIDSGNKLMANEI